MSISSVAEWQTGVVVSGVPIDNLEVVVVGYSARQQRVIGREYRQDGDRHAFHVYDIADF